MIGAATIATAVSSSEKAAYREYLEECGFSNFQLFASKTAPELLVVLFTDKLEAVRYRTNNVEEYYLVHRANYYDDSAAFEDDFVGLYREWE